MTAEEFMTGSCRRCFGIVPLRRLHMGFLQFYLYRPCIGRSHARQ